MANTNLIKDKMYPRIEIEYSDGSWGFLEYDPNRLRLDFEHVNFKEAGDYYVPCFYEIDGYGEYFFEVYINKNRFFI